MKSPWNLMKSDASAWWNLHESFMIHEHPCPGAIPQPRRSGDAPVSADLAAALAVPAGRQGLPAAVDRHSGIPMDWWETTPWSTDWDLIWLVFTKKDNSSSPIDFDGQIDGMGPRPPYRRLVAEMSLWLSGGFDLDFHGGIQQQQWTHIGIWVVTASF